MHLRCSDEQCGATLDLHERTLGCPKCGELLECVPSAPKAHSRPLKQVWLDRRRSYAPLDSSGVWRFRELLPSYDESEVVTLSEGNVPLVTGQRTAEWTGLRDIRFKHLGWNPTGCFKDLGMTVGVTEAKCVGARNVGCASTGNTAASLAAYAARAGLEAFVYLPAGQISRNKLAQSFDFGAEVKQVAGNFDAALTHMLKNSRETYFLNSINPFRIEGQKTAMFELMEQLNWQVPDFVVLPGGNLGNVSAFGKAFDEMKQFGLLEKRPRLIVVQAEGANPLVRFWRSGDEELTPLESPETRATAIRIGNPRSWKKAIRALRLSNGFVTDVSDEEIGEAKAMIGRDGIGCEPASATTLAALRKLSQDGRIDPEAKVVAILTGHALKDTDYIASTHEDAMRAESGAVQA
jgi:threonine synthase